MKLKMKRGRQVGEPPPKMRGLGDLVAKVANPIAKALRLDPAKCGCKGRIDWLNRKVPF